MAYDSKTYGQSPFGASTKKVEGTTKPQAKTQARSGVTDDGLDRGPTDGPNLADKFPKIPTVKPPDKALDKALDKGATGKTDADKTSPAETKKSTRKSRSSAKSKNKRKQSKKALAEAEAEAVELAIAKRFAEEDRRVYLSLLYKTGISGLVWAVLRLLQHELSEQAFAVINTLIDPIMVATVALISILGITFWSRRILNDLAQHTQQLQADAETEDAKSYRPTIEIIGDALEYNPALRKNLGQLFNATSILLCSLISYLVTFALFPTD